MAGGGGGSEKGEPEFQIAPMIDVLLVLLIFFMSITSAEVLRIDKDIVLPIAPNAPKKPESKGTTESALNVKMVPGDPKAKFNLDGVDYPNVEDMVPVLERRKSLAGATPYRVIIRGDQKLPAIEIQRAMTILAQAGLDNIAFSALNKP
jgi:biopolymer transport protein ExbD